MGEMRPDSTDRQLTLPGVAVSERRRDIEPWYHYIILRQDLPPAAQLVNVAHAAGESAMGLVPDTTRVVVLGVGNQDDLHAVAHELACAGVEFRVVVETDGPYARQVVAIGLRPGPRTARMRSVLSQLPLLR